MYSAVGLALLGLANAATIDVVVGDGGLKFGPDSVTAAMGDVIRFMWSPTGSVPHDVVSGDFDSPCQPNGMVYVPTMTGSSTSNAFFVEVNSTDPMWIFCSVPGHCNSGMAMVINPPSGGDQTIAKYQSAAGNANTGDPPAGVKGGIVAAKGAMPFAMSGGDSSSMASMMPTSAMTSAMPTDTMTSSSMAAMNTDMSSMGSPTTSTSPPDTTESVVPSTGGAGKKGVGAALGLAGVAMLVL